VNSKLYIFLDIEKPFSTLKVFILNINMKIHRKLIELESKIIELSKTKSQKEIAVIYETNQPEISKILISKGIKRKKSRMNMSHLSLNINYFKKIDSNDKAYWLGFICGDGNINKLNNKVTLVSKDLEVIEGFKESIGAGHTISKRENFDKRTNKTYTGYTIQIGNEIFTNHLINLGVTSNKTDVLEFPNIDEKYYSYFIAGLFDSDGSVSWVGKNKNYLKLNLITTKEIIDYIDKNIFPQHNIELKYCCRVTKNKLNVWKMYIYSDAYRFLEYIYSDTNFKYYLGRKYNIYLKNINKRKTVRHFRKICQYDSNMNLIKTWNTQQEIANSLKCPATTLNTYLNKFKNKIYINYYWRYENEQ